MLDEEWMNPVPEFSSFRLARYGFGIFEIMNSTHVLHSLIGTESIADSGAGELVTQTWIQRDFPRRFLNSVY